MCCTIQNFQIGKRKIYDKNGDKHHQSYFMSSTSNKAYQALQVILTATVQV